jgi:DNA-binding transcriptional LysR family regulator
MELRHLRYFQAVAEEGHVTRAAERLGIQQPPLSQQIQALEAELNLQLFKRLPRGMELTEAGRSFLADTEVILSQVANARARAERTARGEQGIVSIGFTSSALFHPIIPNTIRLYRERYPLIKLVLEELGTTELIDGLRSESIDAAFIRSPVTDPHGLMILPVLEEPMLVALPDNHPYVTMPSESKGNTKDGGLTIDTLTKEPLILYRRREGAGLYDVVFSAYHKAGFVPQVVQEAPRILSTLNLVAAGLGYTIVPESLCQVQIQGVTYRPIEKETGLIAPINLATRNAPHAAVRRFIDLVKTEARSIGGRELSE